MKAIYIPHLLNAIHQTRLLTFEAHFPPLETLVPVRGELSVSHCKTYLEVKGTADTIVTLTCDRCLQCYNHRLSLDTAELIWLDATANAQAPLEREVGMEELIETLSPQGYFEPDTWLYEQLCLALPQRQICDPDCPGIIIADEPATQSAATLTDHRWAALAALQDQLPEAQGE